MIVNEKESQSEQGLEEEGGPGVLTKRSAAVLLSLSLSRSAFLSLSVSIEAWSLILAQLHPNPSDLGS
jgi:hypothetical protein